MTVEQQFNLKQFNTFRIDVYAAYFISVNNENDLIKALKWSNENNIPYIILGQGSNVLFTKNFDGLIIHNKLKGIVIENETAEFVNIKVASGMLWDELVFYTLQKKWQGLENLSLIPGTVGAAPIQNIGAYGVEVKQFIKEVNYLNTQTLEAFLLPNIACDFAYRTSTFKSLLKDNAFITSVSFALNKSNFNYNLTYKELSKQFLNKSNFNVIDIRNFVIDIRKKKLPDYSVLGNAGSFFKNPIVDKNVFIKIQKNNSNVPHYIENETHFKIPAAWLIEQCNWKGKQIGQVSCYKNQPLVLVNMGNASGADVLQFANDIIESVNLKFNVVLEKEVNVIG